MSVRRRREDFTCDNSEDCFSFHRQLITCSSSRQLTEEEKELITAAPKK